MTDKGSRRGGLENPIVHLAWWLGGAVVAAGLLAWRYAQAQTQAAIKQNLPPGVTLQPPGLAQLEVQPRDRKSVNLTLVPDPRGQLLQSVQLLIDAGAELSFTPLTGVIEVAPIAAGATVTAVGRGSATVTIIYPPDTSGLNDAIIGIGVF